MRAELCYWLGLPLRWAHQVMHNGMGVLRVLDVTRFRPLPHGLIPADHPWATGKKPGTDDFIWHDNVIFRTPRPADESLHSDDVVIEATGRFLACRAAQSAGEVEVPQGPRRRMPHGINYIHGSCHYNSGTLLFTDLGEAWGHFSCGRFRDEVRRFARRERREVLILFRRRDYEPRDLANFSCSLRTLFPWFCNVNGPRGKVLWGNEAPFPAANLITGHWADDVYALKSPGGAARVVRPPIAHGAYFQGVPYRGDRREAIWPERLLAWVTDRRVRMRGERGGLFFVDRREAYRDQFERGTQGEALARW